jgi:outer membrane receptor protein involved in Fe transport
MTGQAGQVLFDGQETPFGLFVEDDWKARPNLSFTLSLRWDDFSNITPSGPAANSGVSDNIILGSGSTIAQQIANATGLMAPNDSLYGWSSARSSRLLNWKEGRLLTGLKLPYSAAWVPCVPNFSVWAPRTQLNTSRQL